MNISEKLTKILLEQEERKQTQGVNVDDTGTVLQNTINFCQNISFLKGKNLKFVSKTTPKDAAGNLLMAKFPEVYNSGKETVAYVSNDDGQGNILVVFGMQDPKLQDRALLGYNVRVGQSATKVADGVGKGCEYLQKIESVGQVQLSAMDQSKLDAFLASQGGLYTQIDPKDPLNYREYMMKDLKDRDGKPLLSNPGEGKVWKQVGAGKQETGNVANEVDEFMTIQGFTQKKPKVGSDEANYGFYLKDVQADLPSLSIDPDMRNNAIYFPEPGFTTEYGEPVMQPSKKTCKAVIKRLYDCKTKTNKIGCTNNLFRDKFIALSCGDKNYIEGPFGKGDEYKAIFSDPGPYGLANLNRARGKAKFSSITAESLSKKINKKLNEDYRKLSYSKKDVKFDPQLVESLADQLVVSALFSLKKEEKKLNYLIESTGEDILSNVKGGVTNLAGNLFSNLSGSLGQSFKEVIAQKIIKFAGFDPNSYLALLVTNLFANLDTKDYMTFFDNCENFSSEITKAALEAWLDMAAKKMMGTDKMISSFVYSALKNMVTEAASKTEPYKRLENMASKAVCGILDGVKESGILSSIF